MKRKLTVGALVGLLVFLAGWAEARPLTYTTNYLVTYQWGGTWQDANKTAANTEDDNMCWAAAASNILAWGDWGTPTYTTTDQIFKHFQDHWTDDAGFANWGWKWWFNGSPPPTSRYAVIDVPGGGNFYPALNYTEYFAYAMTGDLLAALNTLMHQGYGATLTIKKGTLAHAVTAWGYEYTYDRGTVTYNSLFITDSDDGKLALVNYPLVWSDGWYMGGGYSGWKITGLYTLKYNPLVPGGRVLPTPLSPSAVLLATGLALLGVLGRRRHGW